MREAELVSDNLERCIGLYQSAACCVNPCFMDLLAQGSPGRTPEHLPKARLAHLQSISDMREGEILEFCRLDQMTNAGNLLGREATE